MPPAPSSRRATADHARARACAPGVCVPHHRSVRRRVLEEAGLLGIDAPASSAARRRPLPRSFPGRPNIVFVLTDDLSSDLVRYMPHVLAMERHGLTFTNYFVSDSLCCPSRASIFTGDFPHDTHVYGNFGTRGGFQAFHRRGEERHTFAVAAAARRLPHRDDGQVPERLRRRWPATLRADGAATDVPATYVPPGWNEWDVAGWGYPEFNYTLNEDGVLHRFGHEPERLPDRRDRPQRRRRSSTTRPGPVSRSSSSWPPSRRTLPTPRPRSTGTISQACGRRGHPSFDVLPTHPPQWLAPHPRLTRKRLARINWAFRRRAQSVQAVDRMIGEIEQTLSADGLSGSTYLVFSSDNGLHTGEYRLMPGKLTAFDTDIRVPLVVSGPGVTARLDHATDGRERGPGQDVHGHRRHAARPAMGTA